MLSSTLLAILVISVLLGPILLAALPVIYLMTSERLAQDTWWGTDRFLNDALAHQPDHVDNQIVTCKAGCCKYPVPKK